MNGFNRAGAGRAGPGLSRLDVPCQRPNRSRKNRNDIRPDKRPYLQAQHAAAGGRQARHARSTSGVATRRGRS
ncbi:MAG: hypothetical protein PVH54_07135, partial [Gammaproteobacteria bacterium]